MICSSCQIDLAQEHFHFKNKERNILKKICKKCHSDYRKNHYLLNKQKYILKANNWNKKQIKILKEYLYSILCKSQCVDCGEKDIVVLDFDHIGNKKMGIAEMFRKKYSVDTIQNEIDKCEIRCANCHRRRTAKEKGFWKFNILHRGMA